MPVTAQTVDVIVIGGGLSGGLPAAAYLQKAGLQVLVVEANAEIGSFCCTHETWQTLDSPHVGVSFAGNSPVIADLELERYGFRFAASPVVLATTYRDGSNCLICQDPARLQQIATTIKPAPEPSTIIAQHEELYQSLVRQSY